MTGDPRFHALLKEIGDLHDKKQEDYGTGADPFANVRGSSAWGVKPWVGAMVRANDKIKRLQKYAQDGKLANESAHDSFLDGAVYILIASILHDEEETLLRTHRTVDLFDKVVRAVNEVTTAKMCCGGFSPPCEECRDGGCGCQEPDDDYDDPDDSNDYGDYTKPDKVGPPVDVEEFIESLDEPEMSAPFVAKMTCYNRDEDGKCLGHPVKNGPLFHEDVEEEEEKCCSAECGGCGDHPELCTACTSDCVHKREAC